MKACSGTANIILKDEISGKEYSGNMFSLVPNELNIPSVFVLDHWVKNVADPLFFTQFFHWLPKKIKSRFYSIQFIKSKRYYEIFKVCCDEEFKFKHALALNELDNFGIMRMYNEKHKKEKK